MGSKAIKKKVGKKSFVPGWKVHQKRVWVERRGEKKSTDLAKDRRAPIEKNHNTLGKKFLSRDGGSGGKSIVKGRGPTGGKQKADHQESSGSTPLKKGSSLTKKGGKVSISGGKGCRNLLKRREEKDRHKTN